MKPILLFCLTCFLGGPSRGAELFRDDFTQKEFAPRSVRSGEWTIGNGAATCSHDEADYKKRNNHGFVLAYDAPMKDGKVTFTFTPKGCKQLVFMLDQGGAHLFQLRLQQKNSYIVAYPYVAGTKTPADKSTQKEIAGILRDGIPNTVAIEASESIVSVTIGGQVFTLEHPALAQPKTHFSIGFAFGTMAMKEVRVAAQ